MIETDLGVLVGCDRCEGSLREGEGLENTPADTEQVVSLDDVEARVVAMHRVQNDLQEGETGSFRAFSCFEHKYPTLSPLKHPDCECHQFVPQGLQLSNILRKSSAGIIWKYRVVATRPASSTLTYMAVLVECVVGELELEEGDGLLHPVAPWGRGVGVEVGPAGRLGLRFSCHLPFLFIPL